MESLTLELTVRHNSIHMYVISISYLEAKNANPPPPC